MSLLMRSLDLVLPVLCVAALGCSAPVLSPGETDAEPAAPTTAVVLVERTIAAGETARAEAIARFVRMRGGAVDDDALRLVGATIDFPSLGACASVSGRAAQPLNGSGHAVELVDLGALAIEARGARVSLQPRQLPDIVDLVSGVVYSTRVSDPEVLPAEGQYLVRAGGRPDLDIGAFAAAALAPGELGDLVIAGQDARASSGLVLSAEAPTELSWTAGGIDDVVYVDVSQPSVTGPRTIRCLFEDAGRAVIAATSFVDGDGTMTVHRLHRESFQTRGIDSGEIRFDFARVVSFKR
jgi:hypothetical protein